LLSTILRRNGHRHVGRRHYVDISGCIAHNYVFVLFACLSVTAILHLKQLRRCHALPAEELFDGAHWSHLLDLESEAIVSVAVFQIDTTLDVDPRTLICRRSSHPELVAVLQHILLPFLHVP